MQHFTTCPSPLGTITLACDAEGEHLTGLWIQGQKYHGESLLDVTEQDAVLPLFEAAAAWLDSYFQGKKPSAAALPIRPNGSAFRLSVWDILCQIPYGQVVTYGEIAKEITRTSGKAKMSSRAVGGAVGHNPISIIIPCHRVVGADGRMTGYAGGVAMKTKLLALEGADLSRRTHGALAENGALGKR